MSSMYRLNDRALKIQDWIFGWDHKTSYVYNRVTNGPEKAKEIWRKNFGLHDEFQNLGTVPLKKFKKDLGIQHREPVMDPRVRHLTSDFNIHDKVPLGIIEHLI